MATDSLGTLTVDLIANTGGFERGMDSAERRLSRTTRAFKNQEQAADSLVGRIDPVIGATNRLIKEQAELEKHWKSGIIPTSEYERLNKILEGQLRNVKGINKEMSAFGGLSQGQYANAMRGLPAQVTDIFTGLSTGQNPLTVLIQQGGQLKDMFGGLGNLFGALEQQIGGAFGALTGKDNAIQEVNDEAQGLGEKLGDSADQANQLSDGLDKVKSSVSGAPWTAGQIAGFTALAAVIGAVIYAYYDAYKQASAFNKALFSGANVAGQTVNSLSAMADGIGAVTKNYGGARDALIALASETNVSASQLESLATAASAISTITGQGADQVAKDFASMGDEAQDAALKISQKYGLISAGQYDVIHALDEQGEHQQALDTLGQELADKAQQRLKLYRDSLSDIERDWIDIKSAIADAYSAVRSELVPGQSKQVELIQRQIDFINNHPVASSLRYAFDGSRDEVLADLESQKNALLENIKASEDATKAQAESEKASQKYIEVTHSLNEQLDNVTPLAKRTNAIKKLNEQFKSLMEASASSGVKSPLLEGVEYDGKNFSGGAYDEILNSYNKKYKEGSSVSNGAGLDYGQKTLEGLRQQYAALQAQLDTSEKIGSQAKALIEWEQQLSDIKEKKTLTADQKSLLASSDLITAQLKRNAAIEEELNTRKEIQKTLDDYKKLNESLRSDSEKQLDLTKQRFEILDKAKSAGISDEEYKKTAERIVSSSSSSAPKFSGVDAVVSGPQGELDKLDKASEDLESWYEQQLEILNENREKKAELNDAWDQQELKLKQEHEDAMAAIERSRQQVTMAANEEFFGNMTGLAKTFFGEQSGLYKAAFVTEKAYAIAKTLLNAPKTASDAYAAMAGIPVIGPALGIAAAAAAVTAQLAQASAVKSVNLSGMAHDGIDAVPETGTWLLQKGERVTTAATSAKLDKTLDDVRSNQGNGGAPTINLIEDSSRAGQVNTRRQDDQYIIDVVVADLFGDGRTSKAIGNSFGMRRSGT